MKGKALVVDDSSFYKKYITEIVRELGYENIQTASDGAEALSIMEKEQIGLLFLDINMPVVSGIEVIEKLEKFPNKPIIIMMTAVTDVLIMRRCIELGASNYIVKSASAEDIKKTIIDTCNIYSNEDK